jgi:hypothetical protein
MKQSFFHIPAAMGLALSAAQAAEPKFERQTIDSAITIGYGLAIGDVDGDKKPDILLADAKQFVWYKNPTWEKRVIARNLTPPRDHVCIAAQDIDGDGKVEIAVGANWNPGETSDEEKSGSVHYLVRPATPDEEWKPVRLPHEPTVHRMRWVAVGKNKWVLLVAPLHGRGNANGDGDNGAKFQAYLPGADPAKAQDWKITTLTDEMHITHNFDTISRNTLLPRLPKDQGEDLAADADLVILGGKEGISGLFPLAADEDNGSGGDKDKDGGVDWNCEQADIEEADKKQSPFAGAGEIRFFLPKSGLGMAAIEPFHGPNLVYYQYSFEEDKFTRWVIDTSFNQGHAVACADLLGLGEDQIVAGWREPNKDKKVGIRLYWREKPADGAPWRSAWLDENQMACEDVKTADLDGDGKPDVIAAGRATKNVVIYWNKTGGSGK